MPHPSAPHGSTRSRHPLFPRSTIVDHCALLVEYQAATAEALAALTGPAEQLFATLPLVELPVLSTNAAIRGGALAHSQGSLRDDRGRTPVGHDRAAGRHRGAGRAALRDVRGPAAAVRHPRLRRCRDLRPRQGRQHPLPAHRALRRSRQRRSLPRVHRGHGRPRPRRGRHAQGGARHGQDHGAVRRAPVRPRAVRDHARDQARVRPGRHPQPRHRPHRRCRPSSAQPEVHPDRRGRGRPLRRVRLLRAGLPEQGPHHHAAAADRRASRDRRSRRARRHRARRRSCDASRSTRSSTPAPSTACARPPARSSSTPATSCAGSAPRPSERSRARCGTPPARRGRRRPASRRPR